jgi:ribonuclease J
VEKPEILSRGFVSMPEATELLEGAQQRIREIVARNGGGPLENRIETALSEFFYVETKRRPMVFVSVISA